MKRLALLIILCCLSLGVAQAATGFNIIPVLITNNTGATAITPDLGFSLSSQSLINGSWMEATGLDTELQDGGNAVGYMPGTGQVRVRDCFNNGGVSENAACNNATANDMTLPAAAAQVYEFSAESQFSHLWLNISTAGVANWDIVWEYYNGVSYVALPNVTDGTSEFTLVGLRRVSWTFPAAGLWPISVLHGGSRYWIRARVSAFTSLTTAPLGQQAWHETGRWWTTVPSMANLEQRRFDLHLDTSPTAAVTAPVSITASADDTRLLASSGAYPPAFTNVLDNGTTVTARRSASFQTGDVFLRFNTSALPDFISPDTATLACHVVATSDDDNRAVIGNWYDWSGTLGEKDYDTAAPVGTALAAVDITGIIGGGVTTWTLTNLHRVNKSGYTGIRLSVSGAAPAGFNAVEMAAEDHLTLPACVLSVTYDGIRAYHNLFSHAAGWTVTDTAALEPGSAFEITWAGFIRGDASLGSSTIVNKAGAVVWSAIAGSTMNVIVSGVNELDFLGITTGYHTLTLRQVAAGGAYRTEALLDGAIVDTSAAALAVTNNATDWTLGGSSADHPLLYTEYIEIRIGGVTQLTHQFRELPGFEVINQANPGTFNASLRYPDTVANFSATILPLETTGVTFDDAPVSSGDFVGAIPELTNLEPGEHLVEPTNEVFQLFKWAADNSGGVVPYHFLLIMGAFMLCAVATVGSWAALHSVHVTWIALVAASISFIFVGAGIWGWAIPFSVAITGAVYIFYRRAAV